jgi:manganese/iron transport system substrate-binding protein
MFIPRRFLPNFAPWLALVLGLTLTACGGGSSMEKGTAEGGNDNNAVGLLDTQAAEFLNSPKPKIAATSTIVADMARVIAGDDFAVFSVLKPGTDPHIYEPKPGDSRVLSKADVIFHNGFNLEPQLVKVINATQNPAPKVPVAEAGGVKPYKLEKAAGLVVADPHAWGSAANGILYVNAITKTLDEKYPDKKALFDKNAAAYRTELTALDGWIKAQIATIPEPTRKLVSSHDAFQYYGRAYGLPVVGSILGVSTEEEPSAQKIAKLVEKVKKEQVSSVFVETSTSPKLLESLARDAGVKVGGTLYSDSIGIAGSPGDTYVKMLVANTRTIVEALGGNYTAFAPPPSKATSQASK